MFQTFEELVQERQNWVDSSRKNGFEDGIQQLLTELYPDNAHFIYELLQNAEDSGAQVVRFTLTPDEIEFEHNGDRLFDLTDVESITSLGKSNKRNDPTNIGKFGVGFKAVFAYTSSPEIHSGRFHFRIHDLLVPETVPSIIMNDKETRFLFPFNHFTKQAVKAVEEIERGLRELNDNTLLFLSHIHTIEYLFPDGSLGFLKRIEHDGGRIEICAQQPDGLDFHSHWLRYQKDVNVIDEKGGLKSCRIAIAFCLIEDDAQKRSADWKIIPVDNAQVSIFFPATKELSLLKFHIHAPFASTVARDSVRDCEANRQLRDSIANLIVESLVDIRNRGMLSMSFLAVLPNQLDGLSSFYEPIREAIVRFFKKEALTPTKSGSHASSTSIFRGPAKIAEVLSDDDLSLLTNYSPPLWAANPPQQNQREDRFLESLNIDSWGWKELASRFSSRNDEERKIVNDWILAKDDAWLMRFYALLGEAYETNNASLDVHELFIVRVTTEQGDQHVVPDKAFFPPEEGACSSTNIHFVKPSVYSSGRSDAQKRLAEVFLRHIGVRPFDEKAIIALRLTLYPKPPGKVEIDHYDDLMEFLAFWKKNPTDAYLFKEKAFLLGVSADGKLLWSKPEELCIDIPFQKTGLAELIDIHKKPVLWNGYIGKLDEVQVEDFTDFIKAVGVMHTISIISAPIISNPKYCELLQDLRDGAKKTEYSIELDYSIDLIESYLVVRSIAASRLIWQAVIRYVGDATRAQYRPNRTFPTTREADSQLVHHLKSVAWIPDKSGEFHKPQDITRDELRTDYPYDDRNGLLTAIGFGEQAKKRSEEYVSQNYHAQIMGFMSAEEAEKMAYVAKLLRECGQSPDRLLEQFLPSMDKKEPSFPSKPVLNSERREERLAEQISDAPEKEYEKRERSDRISRGTIDPVPLLREQYTDSFGEMFCQICKCEMPFKKRNGEYYFEAIEVLSSIFLPKEFEAQYLALCPLCAAKYQEFVKRQEKSMAELKNAIANSEGYEVPLMLGDEKTSIQFIETHLHDLKIIINNLPNK
jgi:hypothetical protein